MKAVASVLFVWLLLMDITSVESADAPAKAAAETAAGWPRQFVHDGSTITIYQPQLERWQGNQLEGRAAVAVLTAAAAQPMYGVVWLSARTEVDKEHRLVSLHDVQLTKGSFPAAGVKADDYLALLRKQLPTVARTISLDRLQANLAVSQAEEKPKTTALKNEPPKIIVSTRPALLVLIDGKPALRQVEGTNLLRVINARTLLLLDEKNGKYYVPLMDRWLSATALEGPWTSVESPPAVLATLHQKFAADTSVDLLNNLAPDLTDALADGVVPTIYVRTEPTELLEFQGEPDLAPIAGTQLLWAKNTTDQVLLDTASGQYYVLLSGRWFRAKTLKGPWEFVASDKLPADFAKVPETHPRGNVLASVAGTTQAQEAVIASQVPQTTAIKRSEAKLTPSYDGTPQFQPIEGSTLKYAVNSPTPVLQVDAKTYCAVENGVWFTAAAPTGPWTVATTVPPVIYTMPPSAPIYYVTGVQVYGSTPEVVYVGYTPAYFGACVSPERCVVYGTGWHYTPWVGRYWYGRPWTYGFGVHYGWTTAGWGFGFATGAGRPWWGPVGWHAGWGGTWHAGWERGWGGRYSGTHINNVNFNNFNVYNRWGDNVRVSSYHSVSVNRSATVSHGVNNVISDRNGNVYRRAGNGWESYSAEGWKRHDASAVSAQERAEAERRQRQLDQDWAARRTGEADQRAYRDASGDSRDHRVEEEREGRGGYHGGYGGFRGSPGGGRRGGRR